MLACAEVAIPGWAPLAITGFADGFTNFLPKIY
jgi:hypothetical protein